MSERIVICPNPYRDEGFEQTIKVYKALSAAGIASEAYPLFMDHKTPRIHHLEEVVPLTENLAPAKLLIAIGGDGTVLHLARRCMYDRIPVIGMNLGDKGFLAELESDAMEQLIEACRGRFWKSHRMMLDVKLKRDGKIIYEDTALNDVVLKSVHNCIKVTTKICGQVASQFTGDGIILSTPTGSTGYSLSAGGPIVEPEARNIIVTPLSAHLLSARAFVISSKWPLSVTAERVRGRPTVISVDGNEAIDFYRGDELLVTQSQQETIIADLRLRPFYERTLDILSQ